jgi:hypothetical protein
LAEPNGGSTLGDLGARNNLSRQEVFMAQIFQFPHPCVAFDPDDNAALSAAYDKATTPLNGRGYSELVREIIAKRIIAAALEGERDPDRLSAAALASIGLPN